MFPKKIFIWQHYGVGPWGLPKHADLVQLSKRLRGWSLWFHFLPAWSLTPIKDLFLPLLIYFRLIFYLIIICLEIYSDNNLFLFINTHTHTHSRAEEHTLQISRFNLQHTLKNVHSKFLGLIFNTYIPNFWVCFSTQTHTPNLWVWSSTHTHSKFLGMNNKCIKNQNFYIEISLPYQEKDPKTVQLGSFQWLEIEFKTVSW